MALPGGCVCCSLRKDIVKALAQLKKNGAAGGGYDGIVLETTGLADPAPVAFTFLSNPWIRRNYRLDSIVCVEVLGRVAWGTGARQSTYRRAR